jgi:hypothetical protein
MRPCNGSGGDSSPRGCPGIPQGRVGLSRGHRRSLESPHRSSRERTSRLSKESGELPGEHWSAPQTERPDSRDGCGQLTPRLPPSPWRTPAASPKVTDDQPKGHGRALQRTQLAPGMARVPSREGTGQPSRWLWAALGLGKDTTAVGSFMIASAALMTAVGVLSAAIGALPTSIGKPPAPVGVRQPAIGETRVWAEALRTPAGALPDAVGALSAPVGALHVAIG